ncbi:MAG TPA: hypothetical protein VFI47_20180 [Acidimicrobiales bacterium]|nr:hypothetical protein [Acidimicrobiales bacterium]
MPNGGATARVVANDFEIPAVVESTGCSARAAAAVNRIVGLPSPAGQSSFDHALTLTPNW